MMQKDWLTSAPHPTCLMATGGFVSSGRRPMRGTDYQICTKTGRVKRMVLADVIRRVVEAAQPDKIILFGSAARGEMGPNSDLDLLVIKGGKFNYWRLLAKIYRHLRGTEASVDVVLITPDDVERYGDSPCLVIYPALREGKVVYVA
jgi:uncharacterized protein